MKARYRFEIFVLVVLLLFIALLGNTSRHSYNWTFTNDTRVLSERFDTFATSNITTLCESNNLWVGGTLTYIKYDGFNDTMKTYDYELGFRGRQRAKTIMLSTFSPGNIPYKVNKFYAFDVRGMCNHQKLCDDNFTKLVVIEK